MRTIGMLGGMSWESTLLYYRTANELVRDRLGGLHSAKILLDSLDFAEVASLQSADRWDDAGALLAERAVSLERAGAEMILVCTNTMHLVAEAIETGLTVPLLHIGDSTAEAVEAAGLARVALLGTAFTMEQPFLRDRLESRGLEVLVPPAEDRIAVHDIIFGELVQGVISADSRARMQDIIASLVGAGAEGVILGCTEIELLIGPEHCPVPVFPTARLHIEAAVERAFA